MKKLSPKMIAALVGAAVIILIGAFVLFRPIEEDPGTYDPEAQQSSQSAQSDDPEDDQPTNPTGIPNMNSSDRNYDRPYAPVDFKNQSLTTLSKEEIDKEIQEFLPKLLKLDPDAIEKQVSPRTTGGEYNPFRLMLDSCLADKTIGDAFRNMGEHTTYEVIEILGDPSQSNFFDVTLSVSTPYMAASAPEIASTDVDLFSEEFVKFKSSGAAKTISRMNMGKVPMNTDLVELTFLVEEDVLMLYYPISYTYGTEIPQYAFFWGAIEFQGTKDGDLLMNNSFGGCKEVSQSKFGNTDIINHLNAVMENIQKGDMEAIAAISAEGNSMQSTIAISNTYPAYQRLFKKREGFEKETMDRLATLEYDIRYFILTDKEYDEQLPYVAITYSTVDPVTESRAYDTQYFMFTSPRHALRSSIVVTNNTLSRIIINCMGGDKVQADQRLYLIDRLNKNQ